MSFTDCNHFRMSLSLSYWNITVNMADVRKLFIFVLTYNCRRYCWVHVKPVDEMVQSTAAVFTGEHHRAN